MRLTLAARHKWTGGSAKTAVQIFSFFFFIPLIPLVVYVSVLDSAGNGVQLFFFFLLLLSRGCFAGIFERVLSPPLLQRPVLGLEAGQDALAAAAVLAQLGHLLPQRCVLPLQEGGAHRDLVLLQPPGVAGPLGRQVVLPAPGPVPVVLNEGRRQTVSVGSVQRVRLHADLKKQH